MSRLPFEAFLALRYLRPRRTFVSVITVISILGVLLGVAVLIVVISVMSGFDQEWRDRILGFNAHMMVAKPKGWMPDYEKAIKVISTNSQVVGVAPIIKSEIVMMTEPPEGESTGGGFMLLGVDPEREVSVSVLPTNMIRGSFDLRRNGIVVGRDLADKMRLAIGDRVAIYSPASLQKFVTNRNHTNAEAPLPKEFVVRGIYDVGFPDYNSLIVVTSLQSAQELYNVDNENAAMALQVALRDPFEADAVARQIDNAFKGELMASTWKQENPQIFEALAVEKNMMFYLLFFIMIVAAFGIVNCQITFVVQKTREIGILKSLGANNRQVLWIFLSQSVVVGILGVGLGFGLALLALHYRNEFLDFMRRMTGADLLPSSIYGVYELPASIQVWDITVICGTALLTCILAGLFPAWKASRLQPVEALRYE